MLKLMAPLTYPANDGSTLGELDSETLHRLADFFQMQADKVRTYASTARSREKQSILSTHSRLKRRGDLIALGELIRSGDLTAADAPALGFTPAEARAAVLLERAVKRLAKGKDGR